MTWETVIDHSVGHDFLTAEVSEYGRNVVDVASEVSANFGCHISPKGYLDPITNQFVVPKYETGNKRGKPRGLYVLRNDTMEPLGDHSGRYPHRDGYKHVFETIETLFPNSCTDITVFGKGERLAITQQISDRIEIVDGDWIDPIVITIMSLNGVWPTGMFAFDYRISCANILNLADAFIKVKATKNHDDMLTFRSAVLEASRVESEQVATFARKLSQSTLSDSAFYRMLNRVLPVAAEDAATKTKNVVDAKRAAILNAWSQETNGDWGNGWLAYNAFQGAEQHRINQGFKDTTAAKQKGLIKSLDGKTPIADAAEEYLREQLLVGA
tara:strand:+ start:388 stop:1368 length:981 start_codon:yes stop_codon:yes gene_type:complete